MHLQASFTVLQEAEGKGAKGKRTKEEVQQRNKAVSCSRRCQCRTKTHVYTCSLTDSITLCS